MTQIRIVLNEKDFKKLVSGKEISIKMPNVEVTLILKDIGFGNMYESITEVLKNSNL